jgi:hypothetical protein
MIEFMVLSAPRSASTWCANWLTTDVTLCLHDPLFQHHYRDFDAIASSKRLGIACTGTGYFVEWVNDHPARKVILHRDPDEVASSLAAIGLTPPLPLLYDNLARIDGMHVDWTDVFEKPAPIYEHLTGLPFDAERHAALCDIEMQPHFTGLKMGADVTRRMLREFAALR